MHAHAHMRVYACFSLMNLLLFKGVYMMIPPPVKMPVMAMTALRLSQHMETMLVIRTAVLLQFFTRDL
jgi:hypothetical protein